VGIEGGGFDRRPYSTNGSLNKGEEIEDDGKEITNDHKHVRGSDYKRSQTQTQTQTYTQAQT
jgi:hypothetical protein